MIAYSTPYRNCIKPEETIKLLMSLERKAEELESLKKVEEEYKILKNDYHKLRAEISALMKVKQDYEKLLDTTLRYFKRATGSLKRITTS